jgi:hypothetical protein
MPSRVRWLVACLVVSLVSTGAIAAAVYPRWMKTYSDALGWGLVGSGPFLLATLIAGFAAAANRETPLPTGVIVVLVLLLGAGMVWALLWTVAVGL